MAAKIAGYTVESIELCLAGGSYCWILFPRDFKAWDAIRIFAAGPATTMIISTAALVAMMTSLSPPTAPEAPLLETSPFVWSWFCIGLYTIFRSLLNFTPFRRSGDVLQIEKILWQIGWSSWKIHLLRVAFLIAYLAVLIGTAYGGFHMLLHHWTTLGLL